MATNIQLQIASLCNIDVSGLSKRAAAAVLRMTLADEILDVFTEKEITDNQKALAEQLEIKEISSSCEIAALQIEAEFIRLNEEAMQKHNFVKGMHVRFIGGPNVYGLTHEIGSEYVISTVKPNGRIYFKQSNGASAYANQLEPIT